MAIELDLDPRLLPTLARVPGGTWALAAVLAQAAATPDISAEEIRQLLETES